MNDRENKQLSKTRSLPTAESRLSEIFRVYEPRPVTARRTPTTARPGRYVAEPKIERRASTHEKPVNVIPPPPEEPVIIIIPPPIPSPHLPNIRHIRIGENSTEFKMTPYWFEIEDQQKALQGIVYPDGVTDHRPFDSVTRYRAVINKTNNFKRKSLSIGETLTETLVIALDKFAQQFGGDLTFTKKDISFTQSVHRTACGIGDLGSAHLLATNHIPTAKFVFKTKLDYKKDLAKSEDTIRNFILSFSTAIAETLRCENDYVRVLAIEKDDRDEGKAKVNFGITTPEQVQTEILAKDLEDHARSGFRDNSDLRTYIKSGNYRCELKPLLEYLQLRPQDFNKDYDFNYNVQGLCKVNRRGGYPYYVPLGWYRHGIDISKKYFGDDRWLGCKNIEGEWPVAFHGTHAEAVNDITRDGLSIEKVQHDSLREEAVQEVGLKADRPGLYLATRCIGGAHPYYTKSFSVFVSETKTERFRVVFQCRVKPGEFTTHTSLVSGVETWRVVDPNAVRPYGILLRKRKLPKYEGDDSESEDDLFN